MVDLNSAFEKFDDEYLEFGRVVSPLHARPDISAFLLIDKLVPRAGKDIISAAEHDEFFIDCDCDELAKAATEEDILTLVRCGVRYDDGCECLAMFA